MIYNTSYSIDFKLHHLNFRPYITSNLAKYRMYELKLISQRKTYLEKISYSASKKIYGLWNLKFIITFITSNSGT